MSLAVVASLLGLVVSSCDSRGGSGAAGQPNATSVVEGVCSIARDLRDVDGRLGAADAASFEVRDFHAVELRSLLGRLRVEARRGRGVFLDAIEDPTLFLETAHLADQLTVHDRQEAEKLSEAVLSECGFALSPTGALLRPTTYVGQDDEAPPPTGGT